MNLINPYFFNFPASLAPYFWFDADDASTLFDTAGGSNPTAANGYIARWANKGTWGAAGNGTNTAGPAVPTRVLAQQNGRSVARFNGSQWLETGQPLLSAITAFAVFKPSALATPQAVIIATGATPVWEHYLAAYTATQVQFAAYDSTVGVAEWALPTKASGGTFVLLGGTFDGTDGVGWLNNDATIATSAIGSPLFTGTMRSTIGSLVETGGGAALSQSLIGDIAEILIFNYILTAQQITNVKNYLNSKWAIY